jgi:hypothetical protein
MSSTDKANSTDFTDNAWDALYDAVDSRYFQDRDADLIYAALLKRLRIIPFGEYLKRYIYRKAGLTAPFDSVTLKEYQQIIKGAFADNNTPPTFEPTTAKLSALSKNWLTQQTVRRSVVFLLGFGLAMSVEDVNAFLKKALREQGINAKDPFEVICWYCFKNGYGYLKFEKLWRVFCETPANSLDLQLLYEDLTIGARNTMQTIHSDAALLAFVTKLKTLDNRSQQSVTAKRCFDTLFQQAKEQVAALYNREAEEAYREALAQYRAALYDNERLSDAERLARLEQRRQQQKVYTAEDISESDLEHIISSAIPLDRYGNLTPGKASKLNEQFAGKRFSRQHISDILSGKAEVTRFDLITLNFFVFSQSLDAYPNVKARYVAFVESTNRLLEQCGLGELYISNPYECFVLMCILSEDPLGTYADVWELSYE